MLGRAGPRLMLSFWFYTTYVIVVKAEFRLSATYNENAADKWSFCALDPVTHGTLF